MKLFTLDEANGLLPTLKGQLRALQVGVEMLQSYRDEAQLAAAAAEFGGGGMKGGHTYVRIINNITARKEAIQSLGVQIKDFERGLIDFPCMRDGRIVLLCWQLGDGDEIEWWHDIEAGFSGRQPI